MKDLITFIEESIEVNEAFRINKDTKIARHIYFPKDNYELNLIIDDLINENGDNADLNYIDTSNIEDMSRLFMERKNFNGDISKWDVSHVKDMSNMFQGCEKFNCDISNWDVHNVESMTGMFSYCENFNQNISYWDIRNCKDFRFMFFKCKNFNQDLSNWKVGHKYFDMFKCCKLKKEFKPTFM